MRNAIALVGLVAGQNYGFEVGALHDTKIKGFWLAYRLGNIAVLK
jgi:hypothetical protein